MIYLDNAATSYPKPDIVYEEMNRCHKEYCANPGRGGHNMSISSGKAVLAARETVCRFFNMDDPMRLCFTKNATEGLNIAIKGYLKEGDHVITTTMEHNSVIRPLKTLERDNSIELSIVDANEMGEIDAGDIKKNIKKNTRLVVCTLSSNVNGTILPIKDIGMIAKEYGIAFLLDASQGAGTIKIDLREMNIGMMAFPGHKGLLGPQGTGGLYVSDNIKINPIYQGGTGSNSENVYQPEMMPDKFESGTLNTPGIVGLDFGIKFIEGKGIENLSIHKSRLVNRFIIGINELKGVELYSINSKDKNSGIIALNLKEFDANEVSYILDREFSIATRAGLHCAPLAHKALGTLRKGVVRFSVGCFNTINEIDTTIDALKNISKRF